MHDPTRRSLLAGAVGLFGLSVTARRAMAQFRSSAEAIYGAVSGEPFPVPAINLRRVRPEFLRAVVSYDSAEPAGTIVIDPSKHFLYLVNGDGSALRYGVGVGREGFLWSGNAEIKAKREWPDWYPPKEMLERDPSIMRVMSHLQSGIGMAGGPGNPLGARAMYLFQGNKDTLYRIHGTVEPWTIGSSVSSGCIRMINQDVMDLFGRVPIGTKVVVLGNAQPSIADRTKPYSPDQGSAAPVDPGQPMYPDQAAVAPRGRHGHQMYPDQDPYFAQHGGAEYDPYAGQY